MAIAKGELLPGQQIKETEIQDWFKVSRAPVREALRLLQGDNLIVVDNFKKRWVRRITKKNLEELFPVMACLEGLAAGIAAPVMTSDKIKKLTEINAQMETYYQQRRYDLCAQLNFEFHTVFIKAIDNDALTKTIRSLTKGIMWLWMTNIYFEKNGLIPLSIAEHDKIIAAFHKRDGQAAESMVREHITKVFKRSLKYSIFDKEGDYIISGKLKGGEKNK